MKVLTLIFVSLLAVSYPTSSLGQSRSSIKVASEKAWPSFFASFRSAVRAKDRKRLRNMLAADLLFSLGHHRSDHLDEAFKYWDEDNDRGWKAFNRILDQGTVPQAAWWNNGNQPARPARVAPAAANRRTNIDRERIAWYAIFEFREDGRWYCVIFQACCD
jgi:hypothetical protein